MTCLMNYQDNEASELQDPQLISLVASQRSQLASLHSAVFSSTTGLSELRQLDLAPTFEDTLWAVCMVNSRCFSETIGKEIVTFMVPAADLANHSSAPNAEYRYNAKQDAFQLVSLREIPQGEEVCISYGCIHKSNPEMLRDYGFFVQGNLCDRIEFFLTPGSGGEESNRSSSISSIPNNSKLPPQPSLNATRFMAVMGMEGGVKSGSRSSHFELSGAWSSAALLPAHGEHGIADRRKVVTLLSLGAGHLRSIPKGSVAEAMGVLQMSEEEVQWERKAVAELERRCVEQLNAIPTSIETDEELLKQGSVKLGLRRWAAVAARLESKRKLEAAAGHLRTYAETLS
jgi:SET domain/Rubisco LSMT substrate-binding